MSVMIDVLQKNENTNCGETIKDTSEMITVTIALAEYRSLVAENEMYKCENARLREITDQAIEEKNNIKEQWERQQRWYESRMIKEREG